MSSGNKDDLLKELFIAKNEFSEALRLSMLNIKENNGVSSGQSIDESERPESKYKDDIHKSNTTDVVIDEDGDAQIEEQEDLSGERKRDDDDTEENEKHHRGHMRR